MRLMRILLALVLATGASAPLAAEEPPCELHVWAQEFKREPLTSEKRFAFTGDPTSIGWLIEPAGRAAEFDDAALLEALQMPADTRIFRHGERDAREVKKIKTRIAPGTSPCYADLLLHFPVYWPSNVVGHGNGAIVGKLAFRRFGAAPKPYLSVSDSIYVPLLAPYDQGGLTEQRARAIASGASNIFVKSMAMQLQDRLQGKQ